MTNQALIIDGFFGSAIVRCPCGNQHAIIVPIITGAVVETACRNCGRVFSVNKLTYDADGDGLRVRVAANAPKSIEPATLIDLAAIDAKRHG